jgi:hypothetical protein
VISARSRGQLLPLWSVGILASLVLMYFAINYGNMLRWQIRAQNNADAAAALFVSLQTESWNQMTSLLYASDIEEFRIRKQLDNLYVLVHNGGGCRKADNFASFTQCRISFNTLRTYFAAAVTRYTADATVLQSVIQNATFSQLYSMSNPNSDMNLLLKDLNKQSNCLSQTSSATWIPQNGDCAFYYSVLAVQERGGLKAASEDAWNRDVPIPGAGQNSYNKTLSNECTTNGSGNCNITVSDELANAAAASPYFNNEIFSPAQVEIATCSDVKPIIQNFFGLKASDFYAVGRAAATSVIVDQDWLQPGKFQRGYNPPMATDTFQDLEPYDSYVEAGPYGPQQYLNLSFGGQPWTDFTTFYQWNGLTTNDFEAETAWWAPIPIAPFSQISGAAAQAAIGTTPANGACQAKRFG